LAKFSADGKEWTNGAKITAHKPSEKLVFIFERATGLFENTQKNTVQRSDWKREKWPLTDQ
jgi:hypothetical protein